MKEIVLGVSLEKELVVTENYSAKSVGSGDVNVFATPMMIALMESAAAECLLKFLDEDMTSVGTHISSSHLAATPIGASVRAIATITAVDGKKVSFTIKAFDQFGEIGEGTHDRVIVNRERFNEKAKAKLV